MRVMFSPRGITIIALMVISVSALTEWWLPERGVRVFPTIKSLMVILNTRTIDIFLYGLMAVGG